MRWGPHLRGGPRLQLTSPGQESGNGCRGNASEKEKQTEHTPPPSQDTTDTQARHTDKMNKMGGSSEKGGPRSGRWGEGTHGKTDFHDREWQVLEGTGPSGRGGLQTAFGFQTPKRDPFLLDHTHRGRGAFSSTPTSPAFSLNPGGLLVPVTITKL